jgi:hypothetical protein
MRQVYRSVHIQAAPHDVWRVLSDFARYRDWNPFIREGAGEPAVGSTLTLRFVPADGRPMTFRPTVLAADPGRQLCWRGRLLLPGLFDGTHRFTLSEVDGGTLVEQSETFAGVLVPLMGTAIGKVGGDFERLNAALKSHVEESAGTRIAS